MSGVIDGKFESGYLCTVRIGGEQLNGVLYQTVQTPSYDIPKHKGVVTQGSSIIRHRRRRRKKSEIKKRDPAHPKPNRSGYNFFFAEEHARLKLLHTGKDRAISRLIGEEWNKLTESEKAVSSGSDWASRLGWETGQNIFLVARWVDQITLCSNFVQVLNIMHVSCSTNDKVFLLIK